MKALTGLIRSLLVRTCETTSVPASKHACRWVSWYTELRRRVPPTFYSIEHRSSSPSTKQITFLIVYHAVTTSILHPSRTEFSHLVIGRLYLSNRRSFKKSHVHSWLPRVRRELPLVLFRPASPGAHYDIVPETFSLRNCGLHVLARALPLVVEVWLHTPTCWMMWGRCIWGALPQSLGEPILG
jgi:hypothetical protein